MVSILNHIYPFVITPLVLGFSLDTIIGDPYRLPHPVKLFGKLIAIGEKCLNKGENRVLKGGILTIILLCIVIAFLSTLLLLLKNYPMLKLGTESIFVFYGIANKNLITECLKVEKKLMLKGLIEARKQVSTIVGRDTAQLSENQIRIATLETLSENLSDGVIGPLFYYAVGGIPAMFAYKIVNTLDSMIGYKNDRFQKFGKIAAKTDDILNFIPARLTAFLMVTITMSWRGLSFIFKYGNKHSSPNAGYPEAALAGILNCRFGGPNYYQGKLVEKPYIGENERVLSGKDLRKAVIINFAVTSITILLLNILLLEFLNRY